jgi:transposase
MPARFVNIDHDTPLLLPPDLRDWVPADHLVHFIMDAVEELDLSGARVNERGTGDAQYPPRLLLGLLIYSYATGVFSSRQIERGTYEQVAVRLLCADTHPDHDTICTFRREQRQLLARSFGRVLELAAQCKVLKVGAITVAIDGTKVLASASKHAAVSYGRAGELMQELDLEVEELLRKAEDADSTPLEDGLSIPAEVQRRQERKGQLAKARAEIEARAEARAALELLEYERKVAAREAAQATGKKPRGKPPQPPSGTPGPQEQVNFTDPQSRIMPVSGGGFAQCYNAQAAVEVDSRLIVGQRVSDAPNDKEQLVPTLGAATAVLSEAAKAVETAGANPVSEVLIDSGFLSEAAVRSVETDADGQPSGVRVLAPRGRERHGRRVGDLEKKADPPAPAPEAPWAEQMAHRVATKAGRARYKLRQQTVEPIFGIIKAALGFRAFRLRGLAGAATEWTLITLAYNLRRLHRLGADLKPA